MASRKKTDPSNDEPEPDGARGEEAAEGATPEDAANAPDPDDGVRAPEDDAPKDDAPEAVTPEDVEAQAYDASSEPGPTVDARSGSDPASSVGGMLCHLSILCHFVAPILSVVVPLALWLVLKDEDPEMEHHGREALNLQLCLLLASVILMATCLFAFLIPVLWMTASVFAVLAAVDAHAGRRYRYPGIWRPIN